ncbi:MAG TPA: PP2C family protein-serine/threonine phosphatase, partial [Candidatus Baltobacteraceae bacterium]
MQRSTSDVLDSFSNGLLMVGLAVALSVAWYLSYRGNLTERAAFSYHVAVTNAQRDIAALRDSLPEADAVSPALAQAQVNDDAHYVNAAAQDQRERVVPLASPLSAQDIDRLSTDLDEREHLAAARFDQSVRSNLEMRDFSFASFALLGAIFIAVRSRLRRSVREGRALVDRLQRAFMSRHRVLPNIDVGTVLLSATRGSHIGGDMYDVFCGTNGYGYLLVADVSGKGIDAAVDTAFIKYTVRALFNQMPDPGRIISTFSSMYAQTIANPESFVVLFLAVVNVETCEITYASAGHEPAFVRHDGTVTKLPATGPIVGIDAEAIYGTLPLPLAQDDHLVLATDGLTETRDRKGRLLGADGVALWLAEIDGSAQEVADRLVRRLRKRSGN